MSLSQTLVNRINDSSKNQNCREVFDKENINLANINGIPDNIVIKKEIEDETMKQLPCSNIKIENYNTGITEAITNSSEFTNYAETQNLNHDSTIINYSCDDEPKNCGYESIVRNEINKLININDQYSNVLIKQEVIDEDQNHEFEDIDIEIHVEYDTVAENYNIIIKEGITEDTISLNNDVENCDNIKQKITEPNNLLNRNFEEFDVDIHNKLQIAKQESSCSSIDKKICEKDIHIKDETTEHSVDRVQQNREMYKDFSIKKYLENLARIEAERKEYNCGYCGEGFAEKCNLTLHYKEHPDYYPYKCQYCNKKLKTESSLKIHKEYHLGEVFHICKVCNKQLRYASDLRNHMKAHDERNLIKCDQCDKKFYLPTKYKTHMKSHSETKKLHKCKICGAECRDVSALSCHMIKHTEALVCKICQRRFTRKTCYDKHILTHVTHKCADCGKTYPSKKLFDFHLKTHVVKDRYGCVLCQISYADILSLSNHLDTHTNDRRVKCKICNNMFRKTSLLNKHVKIHL